MNYSFADRSLNVPSSGIGMMMRYAASYDDVLSLGQGTPLFPTPQYIYDYVAEQAKKDPAVGQYSTANVEKVLLELIAGDFKEIYGFKPELNELALTVGGVGGLMSTFLALLDPLDEIIYFDPSYPIHLSQLAITQAKVVYVSLKEDEGWKLDFELLEKSITPKTKAILLTNPNNPTGTVLSKQEVERLAEIVLKNDLYLILDEAYQFLSYDEFYSPLQIEDLRKNTICIKSFSKEFAMTGWRIGYVYANAEVLNKIAFSINTYLCISPATIAIHAAIAALSDPRGKQAMHEFYNEFLKSREVICNRMESLSRLFSYHKPQGAYYLFPKILAFEEMGAIDFCKKLVDEARVITIPGDSSGPAGQRHIRMSFAAKSDLIEKAFDRISEFAGKYDLL
jgi:aminotransferase